MKTINSTLATSSLIDIGLHHFHRHTYLAILNIVRKTRGRPNDEREREEERGRRKKLLVMWERSGTTTIK